MSSKVNILADHISRNLLFQSWRTSAMLVMDKAKAIGDIRKAWIAGIISGAITLGIGLSALAGFPVRGYGIEVLIDAAAVFGLAFGVYNKSRVAAILLFTYFVGSKIYIFSTTTQPPVSFAVLILGYFFLLGIIGTFAYHKIDKTEKAIVYISKVIYIEKRKRSRWWYVLPIFVGIIGGLIGYFAVRHDDPILAGRLLYVGFALLIVELAIIMGGMEDSASDIINISV